jgi:AcrR family transcriptional regulator
MKALPKKTEPPPPLSPRGSAGGPPGKIKIAEALKTLIEKKDFHSITTAEIAKVAGVNEALIYRYFGDKRGLLHEVLAQGIEDFMSDIEGELRRIRSASGKLRRLLRRSMGFYLGHRVFARMLLLEVRNFPGYFESRTYSLAKSYARLVLEIVREGIACGEFRDDLSPLRTSQVIMGGMEHLILPAVVFGRRIGAHACAETLCAVVLEGIVKSPQKRGRG